MTIQMQKTKTRKRRRPLVGRKFCVMKIRRRLVWYPMIRNELSGVFMFSLYTQSGRCRAERQVVAPASRSEIRDGAPWERRPRSSLRSTLQDAHPSWAGTSGLWLRIHLCANYETACHYIRRKRKRERKQETIGGNRFWN